MKVGSRGYLVGFFFFGALIIVAIVQNLKPGPDFSFLWMQVSLSKLILIISSLGLFQGGCITLFLQNLFSTIKRSELTKFDLDPSL